MAIVKKELPLVFQYIQISSPIPFYIYGSDNEKAKRLLPSNAYVLRSAELLTSEKAPNQPIWKVYIEYDDTLLTDGRIVEINGFNVDFSKYLETFGGQLVRFGDDQFITLKEIIKTPQNHYPSLTSETLLSDIIEGVTDFDNLNLKITDSDLQNLNFRVTIYAEDIYFDLVLEGDFVPIGLFKKFATFLKDGEIVPIYGLREDSNVQCYLTPREVDYLQGLISGGSGVIYLRARNAKVKRS